MLNIILKFSQIYASFFLRFLLQNPKFLRSIRLLHRRLFKSLLRCFYSRQTLLQFGILYLLLLLLLFMIIIIIFLRGLGLKFGRVQFRNPEIFGRSCLLRRLEQNFLNILGISYRVLRLTEQVVLAVLRRYLLFRFL